jgi:hypothetical protein
MAALGAAIGAAASFGAGLASQSKYVDAYRNQRERVGKTLQYGRSLYGLRADQAQQAYLAAIGRVQQGMRSALAETERLGYTGRQDINASLEQQLARNRSGAGSVLAQSSLFPAMNRGAYSDARRDLGALSERIAAQRSQIHMAGAGQEASYHKMLADMLMRRGSAEFDMQQALAGRFGNVAPPQQFDFGELFASLFPAQSPDAALAKKHGIA